jgi:hypothetical protein
MWTPITEEDLGEQIVFGENAMDVALLPMWHAIRVKPTKWELHPWGDEGGGFWIVAVFGQYVLWFNDIEWGFNLSRYSTFGKIDEYCCNQDELQHSIYQIRELMQNGTFPGRFGPPQPLNTGGDGDK